jgi:hypothetical protein
MEEQVIGAFLITTEITDDHEGETFVYFMSTVPPSRIGLHYLSIVAVHLFCVLCPRSRQVQQFPIWHFPAIPSQHRSVRSRHTAALKLPPALASF